MSILQELLNIGLVDIGPDDSRFEKMQTAASALAKKFKEEPGLLIPATLVSLDDSVDEDDPMFSAAEDFVLAEWKTLRNTHANRPRELLRSVIIDARAVATNGNPEAAGVVWFTAASPLRHGQTRPGKAAPIIEKLIKGTGEIAEREAISRTGLAARTSREQTRKKETPDNVSLSVTGAITANEIFADVAGAAAPSHPQNPSPVVPPNPHTPNQGQAWSNEFSPRMTAALVKAVNLGTGRLAESVGKDVAGYLNALGKQLIDQLRDVEQLQNEMSQTHNSSRMRLDVLWWSEALYSPSLQVGYRELSLPVAAVAAAIDLTTLVPALSPASISYILGETMVRLGQILSSNKKKPVIAYLDGLADAETDFGDRFPRKPTNDARVPLLQLVGEASSGSKVSSEILRSRSGVDAALQLSSAEFAMWVFRDFQARRLLGGRG